MHNKPTQTPYARQLLVWETLGECHRYLKEIRKKNTVHRVGRREISELSRKIEFAFETTGLELVERIADNMEREGDGDVPGADSAPLPL